MFRRAVFVMAGTVIVLLAAPFLWGSTLVPGSPVAESWNSLFMQVFYIAMVVAAVVWALLIYALVRFRRREDSPAEGPHIHGNTKLEVAWTLAPTVVFAWLLVVSFQGIFMIEEPGEEFDFTVEVTASQFLWTFTYPDDEVSRTTLRVEQDRVVRLEVTSTDVIHAIGIPELGVMMDAVPGRTNFIWFQATQPGDYPLYCREMCGVGHSRMLGNVEVFPLGEQGDKMWGRPPAPEPEPTPTPDPEETPDPEGTPNDVEDESPEGERIEVVLGPDRRFAFDPDAIEIEVGTEYSFDVLNVHPGVPHDLHIGVFQAGAPQNGALWWSETIDEGERDLFSLLADEDATYEMWCDVPGHRALGMTGVLVVGDGGGGLAPPADGDPLLPGFEAIALLAGLAAAVALVRRRR